jgi:hypothetical protein
VGTDADLSVDRTREHLTEAEVKKLIEAATWEQHGAQVAAFLYMGGCPSRHFLS